MIDKIRWFPIVDATGYPQKTDGTQRRIEKHQEEYRAIVKAAKAEEKLDDLLFELYCKKAEQQEIRLEIFTNRKLDFYVWGYMENLKGRLTFFVTLMVSATLCISVLVMVSAFVMGLYSKAVDDNEIFKLLSPAFQTIVGGFIGLLAGVKLSHEDEKHCKRD